jgi:DNA-binding NtrC family response regulator
MIRTGRALVAIADRENREGLAQVLELCGLEPIFCSTPGEVRAILASEADDVVFCDAAFADGSFDDLPRAISSGQLGPRVIVCARLYDPAVYLDVMYRGAFDFIVYPYRTNEVRWILDTAFRGSSESAPKLKVNRGRATSTWESRHVTDSANSLPS